ncbi:putative lipoprotein, partial [Yersinia pestis PY-101]
MLLLP